MAQTLEPVSKDAGQIASMTRSLNAASITPQL
jgi:hypothetical protein